jgi:UDP-3-O-[3-hydroxymyristoyl] N-acetylglucosamine deacetylase
MNGRPARAEFGTTLASAPAQAAACPAVAGGPPCPGTSGGSPLSQRTVAEKIACTGIGLHSGAPVQLSLHPARAGSGVVFVRTDLAHPVEIPARRQSVSSTRYATTLGRGDATVGTVEHLLAALYSLGIDNVRVEVDGPEVPVMDGSAASFVFLIRAAGVFDQGVPRRTLRIRRRIEVRDGEKLIRVEPSRDLRISYLVDYVHPAIGRQRLDKVVVDDERFEREICRARTFGFLHEVESLWRNGLARGGSLDNTVVMDETRVLNSDGLRWSDEFVRHKVLDLIGDLALLGMPLLGHVTVERGGHALHQQLVERILESPDAWVVEGAVPPRGGAEPAAVGGVARASA